jgi:hypothetical protein
VLDNGRGFPRVRVSNRPAEHARVRLDAESEEGDSNVRSRRSKIAAYVIPTAESGNPEPRPETEAKAILRESREAARPAPPPAKPPWWKFWAKR